MWGARDKRPRLALVTGADGGIGSEFCRQLAAGGVSVIGVSIAEAPLLELAREITATYNVEFHPLVLDLTREDSTTEICDYLDSNGLTPDMLVNNAGVFSFNPIISTSPEKIERFIDLHVRSVTMLSREFGRRFAAAGGGWILTMSSMSCWMPMPGLAMYAATKAYLRVFTRSLALELKDAGVKVMVACPGGIATDLFGLPSNLMRLALNLGAVATPKRFVRGALKSLFKGKMQYVNGLTNRLAIVFVASLPGRVRLIVKHKMLDRGITR